MGLRFAGAVAVSGDTIAVAASDEASNAIGINGDFTDTSASNAGAVTLY